MAGGIESIGKGLGVGLAFLILLYFVFQSEEHREFEKALIKSDPVKTANQKFETGDIYFYEIKELDVKAINDGEKPPYILCGEGRIDPSVLEAYPKRVKFESWTSPVMGPDVYDEYRQARRFGAGFNIQMARRIQKDTDQ